MSDYNILEVIDRTLPTLRRGSRQVAQCILTNPSFVVDASLAELAREADVSEPTVLRFCSTIKCNGFRDLKIRIAKSLALGTSATHSALSNTDNPETIAKKIFDFTITSLDWTRMKLDSRSIDEAVSILANAKRIEFYGFGASGIVALDAQQKFPLFGVPCIANLDSHQQFISAAMLAAGDVMVAISNTGTTKSLIELTRIAKEREAQVIIITGTDSPICRYADVSIIAESLDNTDLYTPTISRISALVIIDILSTSVALNKGESHAGEVANMKRLLTDARNNGTV
jgi:DNA-binding MurR/RpiR family transcriptional regulator